MTFFDIDQGFNAQGIEEVRIEVGPSESVNKTTLEKPKGCSKVYQLTSQKRCLQYISSFQVSKVLKFLFLCHSQCVSYSSSPLLPVDSVSPGWVSLYRLR